jgi:uncharacterized glyoxalase superfamily protein PhnB
MDFRNPIFIHYVHDMPQVLIEAEHRAANNHIHAMITMSGVDELYQEVSARGALIHQALEDQPWGTRDFIVRDPDGHLVCFAEEAGR